MPAVLRPPPLPLCSEGWRAGFPEVELEAVEVVVLLDEGVPGFVDVMKMTVVWGGPTEPAPVGVCVMTEVWMIVVGGTEG